ncbi:MAG: hypothetical protein ACLUSW_01275 [Faecalibacterium sp.]
MKFNEMTYTRPDIGALLARCKELAAKAAAAPDGDALVRLYYEQSEAFAEYNTAANLANIHYTCDTRDAYWKAEQDFFDANGPAVTNASVEISRAFLANPACGCPDRKIRHHLRGRYEECRSGHG